MKIDERMSRITAITDFYLSRFGRAQIGIYQLPITDPNPPWFYIFTNTLMVTMRRKNFMPYIFWFRDFPGNRFILLIWASGYFRSDLQDITPVVERAWSSHSPMPISILGSFPLSMESSAEDRTRFDQTVSELVLVQFPVSSGVWYQHTFGGSRIR